MDRVELARRGLDDLLAHDAAEDRGERGELRGSRERERREDLPGLRVRARQIEVGDFPRRVRDGRGVVEGRGELEEFCRVPFVPGPREPSRLDLEGVEGGESQVQQRGPVELGEIRHQKAAAARGGRTQGLLGRGGQRGKGQRLRLLDLHHHPAALVGFFEARAVDAHELERGRLAVGDEKRGRRG